MPPECLVCSPSVSGHTPRLGRGAGKADKKITPPPPEKVAWNFFFPESILFYKPPCLFCKPSYFTPPHAAAGRPGLLSPPRREHQPFAMPDAHGLLMPEEAAARNMGNTKPAFGKKKVSIAIKKYQKCLFD